MPKLTTNKKTTNGFTLIELLIVMAIIGILASVGIASYLSAITNSRDKTRIKDMNQVKTALEQYFEINHAYPEEGTGKIKCPLPLPSGAIINWGSEFVCDRQTGRQTYMRVLPQDPTGSLEYCYKNPTSTTFELFAKMEKSNNGNLAPEELCNGAFYDYKLSNEP